MQSIQDIISLIDDSIHDQPEDNITGGGIIADGYDEVVDQYRSTIATSNKRLASYQAQLVEKTAISNLKIKYTNASGYFIEIGKVHISKVPDFFVHKQTLVNASRFVTQELIEFQQKLSEAQDSLSQREYDIFSEIRESILGSFHDIKDVTSKIGFLDFVSTNAFNAYRSNYCKPIFHDNYDISIKNGRHPVVEHSEKEFITNNMYISDKKYMHIITGPNMGGKSTFLRQNALIVLMAHIGSFVPAESVDMAYVDKIFSRVGASDNLFLGQSTFMVEMQEVANILNNSTRNSFVIIDEIGRGTSTYDGMSLAWAILKENHDLMKAKTLFATHYHELIDESTHLHGVANFSVSVGENNGELVFLRKIVPGGLKKSFGLEVAKIAGLSPSVLKEAKTMLKKLEQEHQEVFGNQLSLGDHVVTESDESDEYMEKYTDMQKLLKEIDVNEIRPIDALDILEKLQSKL